MDRNQPTLVTFFVAHPEGFMVDENSLPQFLGSICPIYRLNEQIGSGRIISIITDVDGLTITYETYDKLGISLELDFAPELIELDNKE